MPDPALVEEIRRVLRDSPFHGEGHRKVWARLRLAGIRTSKRRVLRPMRENALLAKAFLRFSFADKDYRDAARK